MSVRTKRPRTCSNRPGAWPNLRGRPDMPDATCRAKGCKNPVRVISTQLCNMHYQRIRKRGTLDLPVKPARHCAVKGCRKPHASRGYCAAHYYLLRKYGTAEPLPDFTPLPGESWRPVVGWEDLYAVSDLGRIRSLHTRGGTAIRKPALDGGGYPVVKLFRKGAGKSYRVHRLMALAFLGPCPPGQEVRHWDGDPANCSLGNLLYGTRAENVADMFRHGTNPYAGKTHCIHGHEYTEENTRWYRGRRHCRQCKRISMWRSRGVLARHLDPVTSHVK